MPHQTNAQGASTSSSIRQYLSQLNHISLRYKSTKPERTERNNRRGEYLLVVKSLEQPLLRKISCNK